MAKFARLLLIAAAVLLPGILSAADALKLRPLAPVSVDSKGGGMRLPEGVGSDGKSLLVVADTGNGRLLTYGITADAAAAKGEIVLPELPSPLKVQVDPRGAILALDGKSRRIVRVSPSGGFQGYVDVAGAAGAVVPRSFRVDGEGLLYLLDVFSGRLIVADPSGKVLRELPFPKEARFFSDLAVDGKGDVFLIDSVGRRVFAARKGAGGIAPLTGDIGGDADFPTSIAVDGRGRLFVGDQNGGGIVVFGPDGAFRGRQLSMGWKESFLRYPSDLCIGGGDTLYVADRGNNRVQAFQIVQ